MQLSDEKAQELMRSFKEERAKNPDGDASLILKRVIRKEVTDPKEHEDVCNQLWGLLLKDRRASWSGQEVVGVLVLRPRRTVEDHNDRDLSRGDLAAGEGVARRLDRMHDMCTRVELE